MSNDDRVRIRVRVSGTASLEELRRAADDLIKQALEDQTLWKKTAAMLDDLCDEVVKPRR